MRGHDLNHHNRGDEHGLVDFDRVEEAALVECTPAFRVERFWIRGLGFELRVWSSGMFGFWSLGFRGAGVWNVRFQVCGLEPRVSGFDFGVQGLGVLAFGLRVSGFWL